MPPKVWGPTRLAGFLANLNSPTGVEHSDWSRSQGTSLLSIDCKVLAKFGLVSTAGKELQHGLGHHCNINEALDPFAQSEVDRDNYLPPRVG